MRRRLFLWRTGIGVGAVAAAGAGAGCLGDGPTGDGSDEETGDGGNEEPTATTPSIVDETIETTETSCAEGSEADSEATVEVADDRVEITGSLEGPNPCYEAVLATVELHGDGTELAVTIDAENGEEFCQECLGRLEYAATITFEGGVPETVTVTHAERDSEAIVEEADVDEASVADDTAEDETAENGTAEDETAENDTTTAE